MKTIKRTYKKTISAFNQLMVYWHAVGLESMFREDSSLGMVPMDSDSPARKD